MDHEIALQRAVKNFVSPKPNVSGAQMIAQSLGISVTSLYHKVNPNYDGAHCSPEEVMQIQEVTGNHDAHQAASMRLGYMLLPLVLECEEHPDFARRLANSVKEFSDFISVSSSCVADGVVTDNELKVVEAELGELIAQANQLYAAVKSRNTRKPRKAGAR